MSTMRAILKLYRTRLEYTRFTSESASFILMMLGLLIAPFSRSRAARWLMLSHRNTFSLTRQRQREFLLKTLKLYRPEIIDSILDTREHIDESIYQSRIITLKEPNGTEKGVILLKFLDTFTWLRETHDVERLLKDYYIVFEMSYYGCCCPELLQYSRYSDACVVGASGVLERGFVERLGSNLVPCDFAPCSWVDDRVFFPKQAEKKYDAMYVATWNPVKRHHILFQAVKKINDPSFRAVLVGGGYGGTRDEVEAWIDYYGVRDNIVVMEDLSHEHINALFSESRFSVMFSLKEGGNKAIVEGMFANIPCLILNDHVSASRDWVNEMTGKIVSQRNLPAEMLWMRENWHRFSPREWAMLHVHPRQSTAKLEHTIRSISERDGATWTRPLAVKFNQGSYPRYYDNSAPHPARIPLDTYRKATVAAASPQVSRTN